MAIALRYAARSDVGLGRYTNNQDSGYAGPHVLVVADGMGGHAGGDVASSIAVAELASLDGESLGPEAVRHLQQALSSARESIRSRATEDPDLAGMGTTVTAVLRSGRRLVLAHIGDSRAYVLHDGRLTQVTKDHTFVQSLLDEGRITAEEAEHHPQRSVIIRVLGDFDGASDVDTSVREASVGDRWLLCSDGLSGVVGEDTLAEVLSGTADPGDCADRLLDLALRAGAPDNVTCVVADVVEVSDIPPSHPQVVGAAARDGAGPRIAGTSPATRAAALHATRRDGERVDGPAADHRDEHGHRRLVRRAAAAAVIVALLVAGGYAAYVWSRQQYYVAAAGENVAIYRGLTEDVGPLRLSELYEEQDLPLESLPVVWQNRVATGITADDLQEARRIVGDLRRRSALCEPLPGPASELPAGCEEGG